MKLTNEEGRELLNQQNNNKPTAKWGKAGKPKQSESQLQTECVNWFRAQYPQFHKLLFAIPNGGFRNPKTAAILKREGVISGVPDICLAVPISPYYGLYLELKIKGNYLTDNQKEIMGLLSEQGYLCKVIYSVDEFQAVVRDYLTTQ